MLTKEQILAASDLPFDVVHIPEWDGDVRVRAMTGGERDAYDQWCYHNAKGADTVKNIRAGLLAFTICGDDGKLLFSTAEIEVLTGKSGSALDRLFDAARKLNRVHTDAVESAEKN